MIGKKAKRFFFDRKAVLNKLPKAERQALGRGGALVRKIAQRSMRPAARKSVGDLSREERIRYYTNLALSSGKKVHRATWAEMDEVERRFYFWRRRQIAAGKHRRQVRPKRPYRASRPGSPPRTRKSKLLRKRLFYVYQPARRDVIIGPEWLSKKGDAPRLLEEGGTFYVKRKGKRQRRTMDVRPYMQPALRTAKPELATMFADTI